MINKWIFGISLGIIFYNYLGYGLTLLIIIRLKKIFNPNSTKEPCSKTEQDTPPVTLVIAAYNEANILRTKIKNCLEIDYPKEKLTILFVIDGSTDNSEVILKEFCPKISFINKPGRKGKSAALNHAMNYVRTPITIFCDANTNLNKDAIKYLTAHYNDHTIGGVAGEKKVISNEDMDETGFGEGLYWRYESLLKKLDAELYTVAGAAGELFSIKTSLWQPLPENTILDDFIISSRINIKGFRIAYEPKAIASEYPSSSILDEKKRKTRISAGGFQAMQTVSEIFNITKHPILFFQFVSHRFLRWTLSPLCFPLLLISNIILIFTSNNIIYKVSLGLQLAFYLCAFLGYLLKRSRLNNQILKICHYIVFMNISVYLGFYQFLSKKQTVIWEKALRENMVI